MPFGSSMGVMTVEQCDGGWIVCEDGRRVGGTLLHPFESQEAAQRWLDRELASEAEMMASAAASAPFGLKKTRHRGNQRRVPGPV